MADLTSTFIIAGRDELSNVAKSAADSLTDLGSKGDAASKAFGLLATGMAAAAGGIAAGLGASVAAATGFERQISAIGAVAGASASEMQALRGHVLELGAATSFSATEAGQGVEELVKAGVSLTDVMGGGARAALDLAAAGAVSVAEAAELASNAMNVFGFSGADMGHIADVIAGAANASAISVTDFRYSLAASGAVAETIGISFEGLSTAIAVMGQAGIKGSDAGTSLKTMMMNLVPSTNKASDEMRQLGIITGDATPAMNMLKEALGQTEAGQKKLADMMKSGLINSEEDLFKAVDKLNPAILKGASNFTEFAMASGVLGNQFFDAEGKAKSFSEIAQILQDALAGMSQEQQIATLRTLFGSDAIRAASVIAKAGAAGFEEMAAAIGKVSARDVAEERLNNLSGSIEKFKGSVETAAIILGSLFLPALKNVVDGATEGVNGIIDVLDKLPGSFDGVVQAFTNGGQVTEEALAGMEAVFGSWTGTVIDVVGQAGSVWRDTFLPAIQSAWEFVQANAEPIKAGLIGVGVAIAGLAAVGGIMAIAGAIAALANPVTLLIAGAAALGVAWQQNWGDIQGKTAEFVGWFQSNGPLIAQTLETIGTAMAALSVSTGVNADTMQQGLALAFTTIVSNAENEIKNLGDIVKTGMQLINGDWAGAWKTVGEATDRNWKHISGLITTASRVITDAIDYWTGGAATAIDKWIIDTVTGIAGWVTSVGTSITTWATTAYTTVTTWATNVGTAFNTFSTTTQTTVSTWIGTVQGIMSTGMSTIQSAITAGQALWAGVWQAGYNALGAIATGFWNLLTPENQTKLQELNKLFSDAWVVAGELWSLGVGNILTAIVGPWWTALQNAWTTGLKAITDIVTPWWQAAQSAWSTATGFIMDSIVTPWWNSLTTLWTTATGAITSVVTTWWAEATTLWTTATGAIYTTVTTWWEQLTTAWTTGTGTVTTTVTTWWEALGTQATTMMQNLTNTITAALAPWVELFNKTMSDISAAIWGAGEMLGQAAWGIGAGIVQSVIGGINSLVGSIADTLIKGVQAALDKARSLIGSFQMPSFGSGGGGGTTLSVTGGGGSAHAAQYLPLVNQVSQEMGVPADVLAALLEVEGSGATAVSPANARGLMQVVPGQGYDLPGEDWRDPLTSIRQGARAVKDKYNATGSWEQAGRAYFGYGVDAGGMDTNTYGSRYDAARRRYQQQTVAPAADPNMMQRIPLGAGGGMPDPFGAGGLDMGGPAMTPNLAVLDAMAAGAGRLTPVLQTLGTAGSAAFQLLSTTVTATGETVVSNWDPAMQQVVTTTTDASGAVTSTTAEMAQATLTSVTNLGDGTMTIMSDTSGAMIGTVTDMSGRVTSQYATLANGVTLSTADMSGNVLTSVTELGDGFVTTMQDAAGNAVATVTDMSGNVTSQYTTMATGVATATSSAATATGTLSEATATMAQESLVSVTDLGTGFLTTVSDMSGNTISTITDMSGNVTSQIAQMADGTVLATDDMSGNVLTSVNDMGDGVITTMQDATGKVVSTVTDANGKVLSQYLSTSDKVILAAKAQERGVTGSAATAARGATDSANDMRTKVTGAAQAMNEGTVRAAEEMQLGTVQATGEMRTDAATDVQQLQSQVTASASTMSQNMQTSIGTMTSTSTSHISTFRTVAGGKIDEFGNAVFGATGKVEDLAEAIQQTDHPVALAFSANVPSTVKVNGINADKVTGSNTELEGVGDLETGDVESDAFKSNDVTLRDVTARDFNAPKGDFEDASIEDSEITDSSVEQMDVDNFEADIPAAKGDSARAFGDGVFSGSGGAGGIDYEQLGRAVAAAMQGYTGKNFNLTIHTTEPTEPIERNFALLEAVSRSST